MLAKKVEAADAGIKLRSDAIPSRASRQLADTASEQTGKAGVRFIQTMRPVVGWYKRVISN